MRLTTCLKCLLCKHLLGAYFMALGVCTDLLVGQNTSRQADLIETHLVWMTGRQQDALMRAELSNRQKIDRVETEKARAAAHAQDDAQSQVQGEVSRILCVERAAAEGSIQQAVIRERIATEDERLRAQLFAKQLGAREADLKKQDAFYREQVARLEERCPMEGDKGQLPSFSNFKSQLHAGPRETKASACKSAQFYKVTTENYHKAADQ
ncbi:MICOS complex subunit Mic19, partial [Dissostichus eleginoides]